MQFFIPGEFTTLNEHIAAANSSRYIAAEIKRHETMRVKLAARGIPPVVEYPIDIRLEWYRRNKRSDPDNVAFAVKYILDGLQEAGVLKQDTWFCVRSIHHEFFVDRENPGVMVSLGRYC